MRIGLYKQFYETLSGKKIVTKNKSKYSFIDGNKF